MFGRAAVERDVASLGDSELVDRLQEVCAQIDELEAHCPALLGEWDDRALWALDGAATGAGWLAAQGRLSRAHASGLVRTARFLRRAPVTAPAVDAGRVPPAKARLLAMAVNPRTEEAFAAHEDTLLAETAPLSVDQTATALRYWAMQADTDGVDPSNPDANTVHLSQTFAGRWQFDSDLDTESGAIVASTLTGIADELFHARRDSGAPALSAARLRADALTEMARRATAAGNDRPAARPLIWVRADLDDLRRQAGIAQLAGAGPITAAAARRLACDAGVARLLTDGPSVVVDLGDTVRTATTNQRRLLALRDRGCVFPGCDRPPGWCQAHHIRHWIDGGPTDMANMCLACSYHHHLLHEGGFRVIRGPDSTLAFTRPDGTPLTIAA